MKTEIKKSKTQIVGIYEYLDGMMTEAILLNCREGEWVIDMISGTGCKKLNEVKQILQLQADCIELAENKGEKI